MHYRRSIRLKGYDYSRPGAYFVTICTENRDCLFGNIVKGKMVINDMGNVVEKYRLITENHFKNIKFDTFLIMPNHFHIIIGADITQNDFIPVGAGFPRPYTNNTNNTIDITDITDGNNAIGRGNPAPTLGQIVGFLKYGVSKQINQMRKTPGVKLLQRNYYEHIIRDKNDYIRITEYIEKNPIKWELDSLNPGNQEKYHG